MKLNRKGFTLVELLAVIVILAIVVGIALTTVLPTLKKSRQEAYELTANTAADYLEKQYQLTLIGDISGGTLEIPNPPTSETAMTETDFQKAGLKPSNYISGTWYIKTDTGRACVILKAATQTAINGGSTTVDNKSTAGEYYDVSGNARSTGC